MGAFRHYFRQHPWQRRLMSFMVAAMAGIGAALLILPYLGDRAMLKSLASTQPAVRDRGILLAVERAKTRSAFVDRINGSLDSGADMAFAAKVEVLNRLGLFSAPQRPGHHIDRYRLVNLRFVQDESVRLLALNQLLLAGRDNTYVRQGAEAAAKDPSAEVRSASTVLAARLGMDNLLCDLMRDGDSKVRAAAMLDAGLAGRTGCVQQIADMLTGSKEEDDIGAAANALARLDGRRFGPAIAAAIASADRENKPLLLDVLLISAPIAAGRANTSPMPALPTQTAGETPATQAPTISLEDAVMGVIARARSAGKYPPVMALVAAGRMKIAAAKPAIAEIIKQMIATKEKLTVGDAAVMAAAVHAARRLGMPREFFVEVVNQLWHPGTLVAMIFACEALGDLAPVPVASQSAPAWATASAPGQDAVAVLTTAADQAGTLMATTAAAVALFAYSPGKSAEPLVTCCQEENWLAGEYAAWNLSRSSGLRRTQAAKLAQAMLAREVHDRGVQTTGAILLALLERGGPGAAAAVAAIDRLLNKPNGPEQDVFLSGTYKCALAILGQKQYVDDIMMLAGTETFPKNRALIALLMSGNPAGLDMLLGGPRFDPSMMDSLLTGRLLAQVYGRLAPELEEYDIEASNLAKIWQCRILRDSYLLRRPAILHQLERR